MNTAATYTPSQARAVYAMGLVPALDAGLDPFHAVEVIQADNAAKLDERAASNVDAIWIGKTVNDGKLGVVVAIDGNHVTLRGYFGPRRAHIGSLTEWSFRAS